MTDPTVKTAAVIYNPIKVDLDALRDAVAAPAREVGWGESVRLETSVEDVGQGVTKQAIDLGVDLVIAADGIPLALLPSGTGNLLARNLKLTLNDVPDSLLAAFTGIDRPIDLGSSISNGPTEAVTGTCSS